MPEWKKELIQRRKNLAKCMTSTAISGHSHSQQCHGTAANSTQIQRQTRSGGQQRSGSTAGECRATVQSSCERDGERVSHAVASNGSSCATHEDKLCEVSDSGNSTSGGVSGDISDSRDILQFCDNHRGVDKMVAVQEVCGEKLDYDTSEELKYGAGIVSKLVSRFMSYTMRVSTAKERPSLDNLRRATSLNNLLDDEEEESRKGAEEVQIDAKTPDEVIIESGIGDKGVYRHRPQMGAYQHSEIMRRRQMGRGNDSLKRARSVDALLRIETTKEPEKTPDAIAEEIPTPPPTVDVTIEDKIMNARERGEAKPKRLKSFMDDPERPPPDLVKTTLRIFEATANRRGRPPTCRSGEVAAKVASFKSIISCEKPAILYPKPPVSPKKALVGKTVRSSHMVTAKPATVVQEPINNAQPVVTTSFNVIQRSPSPLAIRMDMTYRSVKNFSPTSPQSPKPDLINVSAAPRKSQENGVTMGSESPSIAQLTSKIQSMKIESPGHQVVSEVRKVPVRSGTVSSTTEESDTDTTDSFDDDVEADRGKRISKGELENISRAGATTEFNFGCTSTPIRDKSHLPPLTNGGNLTLNEEDLQDPLASVGESEVNGVKMVEKSQENGVNEKTLVETKEIVESTQCSEKQLTNQEIEKNLINREKSEGSVTQMAPKWNAAKKKPWKEEPQNTTMVFNFSNRKDVPDYIENDGVVLRRRREMPKPGESGFVLLGDAPLETSTDPDDFWTMGPPSPCDVDFSNDNVIINGKSSLRLKSGDSKWKIRFDDSLTSTYEYPSETSQKEEMLNVTSNGKTGLMDDKSFNSPAYQKFLPLGLAAPLANYTPVKGGVPSSDFELGVKRNSPVAVESPGSATGGVGGEPAAPMNGDLESLQYLKPATDEQTVAWSEGTRVTDLLF
uniref:Putative gpi-anchored adhesin-like protein pga55 n=1 Tax=Phlebotomus kandelakii TaxID=1109342 RepID=A0A6B2EEY9_9DIPT